MIAASTRIAVREGTTASRRLGVNARLQEQTLTARRAEQRGRMIEKAGSVGVRLAVTVVTILVVVASGWTAWSWFSRSEFASLSRIEIRGIHRLDAGSVALRTGLKSGRPLVDLELDAVRRALESDPWIADAKVSRRWPHAVRIELVERVPVARLSTGSLVSADGVVLPRRRDEALPLLVGKGYRQGRIPLSRAVESMRVLQEMEQAGWTRRIERVELASDGSMELRLAGMAPGILVGTREWKRSLARAESLRRELGEELSLFSQIDLRHGTCASLRRVNGGV